MSNLPTNKRKGDHLTAEEWNAMAAVVNELDASSYVKPEQGIPKEDLSEDVQDSLDKANSSMQTINIGDTITGEAGTDAGVDNIGTINDPILQFTIPRGLNGTNGKDAVEPFKGWYPSVNDLPINPVVGDYAYIKGATTSDPAAIYECTTAGTWSDSGRTADTSNVQTFASGEEVNEVHIVDNCKSDSATDVLAARQGQIIQKNLDDGLYSLVGGMLECKTTLLNNIGLVKFDTSTNKTVVATTSTVQTTKDRNYYNYKKVKKGDTFRLFATADNATSDNKCIIRVIQHLVVPNVVDVDGVMILDGSAYQDNPLDAIVTAISDGYIAVQMYVNSGVNNTLTSFRIDKVLRPNEIAELSKCERLERVDQTIAKKFVRCDKDDIYNIGDEITDTGIITYRTTDYIDIEGAKYIAFDVYYTASTTMVPQYKTKSIGNVFYDSNKNAIDCEENISLTTIKPTNVSSFTLCTIYPDAYINQTIVKVPSNAKYIRRVSDNSDGNIAKTIIYKEKISTEGNDFYDNVRQAEHIDTGSSTLTLVHFSDIHGDDEAADEINKLQDNLLYDDILCTGDVVNKVFNSNNNTYGSATVGEEALHGYKWWTEIKMLASKCLFTLGNHDGATSSNTYNEADTDDTVKEPTNYWDGKGKSWDHDTYFAPYADDLGVVLPSGYDNSSSPNYKACYWYKDYQNQKIRLIGIDCIHRYDGLLDENGEIISGTAVKHATNEQEIWLKETLDEILEDSSYSGWSVMFACHYALDEFDGENKQWSDTNHKFIPNNNIDGGIVVNYKTQVRSCFHASNWDTLQNDKRFMMRNRVASSESYGYSIGNKNHIGDIIEDWISRGGNCIAWLHGHYHADGIFYPTNYPDILNVSVIKTGRWGGSSYGSYDKSGDVKYTANMYVIDPIHKLFKIIRLGLTTNFKLEKEVFLCYDYDDKIVLNEE